MEAMLPGFRAWNNDDLVHNPYVLRFRGIILHKCNKHKIIRAKEFNPMTSFINIITLNGSNSKKLTLEINYGLGNQQHFQKHYIIYRASH